MSTPDAPPAWKTWAWAGAVAWSALASVSLMVVLLPSARETGSAILTDFGGLLLTPILLTAASIANLLEARKIAPRAWITKGGLIAGVMMMILAAGYSLLAYASGMWFWPLLVTGIPAGAFATMAIVQKPKEPTPTSPG